MKNRPIAQHTLTLLVGVGAGFYPLTSFGLSLGEIQVESHLHEPLRARIEIIGVSDEEWRRLHAGIAEAELAAAGVAHPELFASISFVTVEGEGQRRFIEARSNDVFSEPLFDLPVQVTSQSLQVIRTYSVLLDPAPTSEPQPVPAAAAGTVVPSQTSGVVSEPQAEPVATRSARVDAPGATAAARTPVAKKIGGGRAKSAGKRSRHRRHGRHAARTAAPKVSPHSAAPAKVATSAAASSASAARGPAAANELSQAAPQAELSTLTAESSQSSLQVDAAERQRLAEQIAMLQQTLEQMQATIRSQDLEIARLRQAIAARAEQAASTARASAAAPVDDDSDDDGVPAVGRAARTAFWLGGLAFLGALTAAIARHLRRKTATREREVQVEEIRREMEEISAQMRPRVSAAEPAGPSVASPSATSPPHATAVQPVAAAASLSPAQAEATAVLEAVPPLPGPGEPSGMELWRTQTALLLADLPTEDMLAESEMTQQFVAPLGAGSGAVDDTVKLPPQEARVLSGPAARAPAASVEATASNREIAEILENTLDIAPDRVDVQMKLLEIYHQEALGNRDNFNALLRKLSIDPKSLTPAQLLHIETLQRTLEDKRTGKDPLTEFQFQRV